MSLSTWCLGRCAPLSCTDRSSFTGSHLSVSWKSIAEDAECLMRGDTGSRATHCVPKPCFIKVCPASWWMAEWVSYWETSVLLCVCAHISMSWFTAIRVILNQNICERFRSALRRGAWGERYYSENAVRKQIRHKLTSMQCSKHLVGKSAAYSKLQYRTELRCCFGLKRSCFIQDVSSRCIKHTRFSLVFAVSQTAHWEMSRARGSSNFYQLKISPPPPMYQNLSVLTHYVLRDFSVSSPPSRAPLPGRTWGSVCCYIHTDQYNWVRCLGLLSLWVISFGGEFTRDVLWMGLFASPRIVSHIERLLF